MKVTLNQASSLIEIYIRAKQVPMIHGSPGLGKSAVIHAIAKKFNLFLIDMRLGQCDPTEMQGFGTLNQVTGRGRYAPMEDFPLEKDTIPAGYAGWLLFMDELTSAPPAVQAAAYKVILDRKVGQHNLHKNVAIVAAGNLATDNAVVEEMSTALQSRMVHLEVEVDAQEWVAWASNNGFDSRITSYISSANDKLYTFQPDHTDHTYGCPRTWEFANRLIPMAPPTMDNVALYAGALSEGLAREFIAFCELEHQLPKIADILAFPKSVPVPDEPSVLWMLSGTLAKHMKVSNCDKLMEFVKRIPLEFQTFFLRQLKLKENTELAKQAPIIEWVTVNGAYLF